MDGQELAWDVGQDSLQTVDLVWHFNALTSVTLGLGIALVADNDWLTLKTFRIILFILYTKLQWDQVLYFALRIRILYTYNS